MSGREDEAQATLDALAGLGIDYDDVVAVLETEGVDKFEKSWHELVETVRAALEGEDKEAAQQQASHKAERDAFSRGRTRFATPRIGDCPGSPGRACW